ncbi:MAG: alanine racemase [Bacteroidales bacterium]
MEVLQGPTLIINSKKAQQNILLFKEKANKLKADFRPHFKTHQSTTIGKWFKDQGISKIATSSVDMAIYFAKDGWKDIMVAIPVNINEYKKINTLAKKIKLQIIIDSLEAIKEIQSRLNTKVEVLIEIECGYHRTGINYKEEEYIQKCIEQLNSFKDTSFIGFLSHAGNTYEAKSITEIKQIAKFHSDKLNALKKLFTTNTFSPIISYGDTPSLSICPELIQCDEIRPGNFIFFDYMQYALGACFINEISCYVACPIISKSKIRNELVIYGGAIHFSKEYAIDPDGDKIYGICCLIKNREIQKVIPELKVTRLSQEHGIITGPQKLLQTFAVGDFIGVIPIHSCLTMHNIKNIENENGKKIISINTL